MTSNYADMYSESLHHIKEQDREMAEKDKRIEELEAKLKDRDRLYEAGITAAREEIADLQAQLAEAENEANTLALALWKRHYRKESPDFELCDSVAGVISQIDNISAGISNRVEELEKCLKLVMNWLDDWDASFLGEYGWMQVDYPRIEKVLQEGE